MTIFKDYKDSLKKKKVIFHLSCHKLQYFDVMPVTLKHMKVKVQKPKCTKDPLKVP